MKKVLIATTALVTVGLLSVGAQAADKVKLELGGFSKWFVVGAWNDPNLGKSFGPGQPTPGNVDVKGQSDITFSGSTKLDNGLDVGVFTALRAGTDTGINGNDQNNLIDRAYLYVASGYGKVIVGVLQNASHLLHVQAPESIGQWGEDGMLVSGQIIASPAAGINLNPINSTSILLGDSLGKAEGITYLTPTFYGLTLGGSYIPNDEKNVRGPVNTTQSMKDTFVVGANYTNSFGDVGVKTSFGWARTTYGREFLPGQQSGQKVNIFNTGLNLSYGGFTLGGSFRWNVHDVRHGGLGGPNTLTGFSMNGHAWDAGLMYATGPWAASLSYFGSRVDGDSRTNQGKKDQVSVVQASAKYTLGPGVDLQGLVGYGDFRLASNNTVAQSAENGAVNRGWAVMTGVAVQF